MKIALAGTGQMGQAVERIAEERGHEIVAHFNSSNPLLQSTTPAALNGADVAIDFTRPELARGHIERYCRWGQAAVIGTTGWYDGVEEVRKQVGEHGAAILYAPNFSLGIAILTQALRGLTPLLEKLPEYDAYIHEVHHARKLDSPSGTALMLADVLVNGLTRKTRVETETQHERIQPEALHVTSTRTGNVVGHHTVGLDSPYDQVLLVHDAKNRQGFAFGAVRAAEWLPGHRGLFTLDDVLHEWLE